MPGAKEMSASVERPDFRIKIADGVELPGMDGSVASLCIMCENPGVFKCVQCKVGRYCSHECQKSDWAFHKLLCKTYAAHAKPQYPNCRAILFRDDGVRPIWTMVPSRTRPGRLSTAFLDKLMQSKSGYPGTEILNRTLAHKKLGHGLIALFRKEEEEEDKDESLRVNATLTALGPPGQMHQWRGTVLVMAFHLSPNLDIAIFEDVQMRDFRNIIDAFQAHLENPCVVNPKRYPHDMMPAIKLNCNGDLKFTGVVDNILDPILSNLFGVALDPSKSLTVDHIEEVTVPADWQRMEGKLMGPCAYACAVGLPWFCRGVDVILGADRRTQGLFSPEGTILSSTLGIKEYDNNNSSDESGDNKEPYYRVILSHLEEPGTITIVHKDGIPIHPVHIKLFNIFIAGLTGWLPGSGPRPASSEFKDLKKSKFENFCRLAMMDRNFAGLNMRGVPSPYAWRDLPRYAWDGMPSLGARLVLPPFMLKGLRVALNRDAYEFMFSDSEDSESPQYSDFSDTMDEFETDEDMQDAALADNDAEQINENGEETAEDDGETDEDGEDEAGEDGQEETHGESDVVAEPMENTMTLAIREAPHVLQANAEKTQAEADGMNAAEEFEIVHDGMTTTGEGIEGAGGSSETVKEQQTDAKGLTSALVTNLASVGETVVESPAEIVDEAAKEPIKDPIIESVAEIEWTHPRRPVLFRRTVSY